MTFDNSGNLFVASQSGSTNPGYAAIYEVTPGAVVSVFAPYPSSVPAPLDNPTFLAFTAATPEPSTFVLGALGLLGLGIIARRKQNRVA